MSIDCLWGDSMSGKSSAIEALAYYIHETTGKGTQILNGDGGADTYNRRGLVDDGIIQLWDYSTRKHPMVVLQLMSDLYWPIDSKDPTSKLVAPKPDLFEKIGLRVVEGGAVVGEWLLSDVEGGMAWHGAHKTGFGGVKDEAAELSHKEGAGYGEDYDFQGTTSAKHYGIVQKKILSAVRRSKQFPGHTIWTSHPVLAPDKTEGASSGNFGKIEGKKIYGPNFGGNAPASLIGKEFGNLLHFDQVNREVVVKDTITQKSIRELKREFRLYTRRHLDPNGVVMTEYLAGNRAAIPTSMPDYFTSKEVGDSLLQFYQVLKELSTKAREKK